MEKAALRDLDILIGECRDIIDKYRYSSPDAMGELIEAITKRVAVDADGNAVLPGMEVATGLGDCFCVMDVSRYGEALLDDDEWYDLAVERMFVSPLCGVTADGYSFSVGDTVYFRNDRHFVYEYVGEGIWKLDGKDGVEVHEDKLWNFPTCMSADGHAIVEGDIVYSDLIALYTCDVDPGTQAVQCCPRNNIESKSWYKADHLYYWPRKGADEMLGVAANLERKYPDDNLVSELAAYLRRLIREGKAA